MIPPVADLVEYYRNLLIIQYHNKPKAAATIELFMQALLADNIFFQIQDGYNLNGNGKVWEDDTSELWDDDTTEVWSDTGGSTITPAVGKQLDVRGKYAGVDRAYRALDLVNYFSFATYDEDDPDAEEKFGFSTYDDFDDDDLNGTLTYSAVISKNNLLLDEPFRKLINLQIFKNYSNFSYRSINDGINRLFGPSVRPESSGGMMMYYFVAASADASVQAAIYKQLLPYPMAVGSLVVTGVLGNMFGFATYDNPEPPFAYGFSTYDDYDSLPGQILEYDQIQQG